MYYCIIKTAFVLFIAINLINCEQDEKRSLKPTNRNQLLAKLDRLSKLQASKSSDSESDDSSYVLDGSSLFDKLNAIQKVKFNSNNDHMSVPEYEDEPSAESTVDFKVKLFNPYDGYYKKALSYYQPHAMRMSNFKRSFPNFFPSDDVADRLIKGKRVNRNMFSSGLQGVWGVPGR